MSIEVLNTNSLLNLLNEITEGKIAKTWLVEIKWDDGSVRRSYLKVFSLPLWQGIINEVTGYLLAKQANLPLPYKAGLLKLPDNLFPDSNKFMSYGFVTSEVPGNTPNSMYNISGNVTAKQLEPIVDIVKTWKFLPNCMAFDDWTANTDRHFGNIIFSGPGDMYLIDHSNLPIDITWEANQLNQDESYDNKLAQLINFTDKSSLPKKMAVSDAAVKHSDHYNNAYNELKKWWDILLRNDPIRRDSLEKFIEYRAQNGRERICKNLNILAV